MKRSPDRLEGAELSVAGAAAEAGDRLALVAGGRRWTWAQLAADVDRERRRLATIGALGGQGPGPPRVAFDAHPDPGSVIRILALAESEACIVPLHPRLPPATRLARLRAIAPCFDLDADAWIESRGRTAGERWITRPRADHEAPAVPLAVLFTSGSTGEPLAVELSRAAFCASASASTAHLGREPGDRWLCCLPLAHVGGLSIVIRCLFGRLPLVLAAGFDAPEVAGLLERERMTLASFVPTMLHRLLRADSAWRAPDTLRLALIGGAAGGADLWAEVARRGFPAVETYGMTETCSQVATARPDAPRRLIPLEGVRLRVADGRIEVGGPTLCTRIGDGGTGAAAGRWTDDGFLRTGDAGVLEAGLLEVRGRADATMITGGENVVPATVEAALARHPAIRRAVVFGVPDPEWGEVVAAVLEPAGHGPRPSARELHEWLAGLLAPYERPRRIAWLVDLPETLSGKLDRAAARERCRGGLEGF